MWSAAVSLLLLFTSLSECGTPTTYVYRYSQVRAVTPTADNDTTTKPPAPPGTPLGPQTGAPTTQQTQLDVQLLQDVFGLPEHAVLSEPVDEFKPSVEQHDEFDWRLTKQLASSSDQNLLVSPLGIKLALAILTEAAAGTTAAELQFTLGFDPNATRVRAKFQDVIGSLLTKSEQYILELGSRIYVGLKAEPRQKFAAMAEQHYRTEIRRADFDHPAAAADINAWIANVTHGRIPQLLTPSDLQGIAMMIINTLYFKGTWRHPFEPNNTLIENFYVTPTSLVTVPFMTMEDNFYYGESVRMQAKILRMPYMGNKFSMYLIVPNAVTGLSRALKELTSAQLKAEINFLKPRRVRVSLPRFSFEYTSELKEVLRQLGIVHAFETTASFPGIARGEGDVKISRVMQRSGIEVNELGSVAYTATVVSLVNRFGDEDDGIVEVRANKPFIFYIEDETTRQLLFTGRIANPFVSSGQAP